MYMQLCKIANESNHKYPQNDISIYYLGRENEIAKNRWHDNSELRLTFIWINDKYKIIHNYMFTLHMTWNLYTKLMVMDLWMISCC